MRMFQEKTLWVLKSSKFLLLLLLSSITPFLNAGAIGNSNARNSSETPKEFENVGIDERLGEQIDLKNLHFTDENGKKVTLSDYSALNKPVVYILGYYECPKLCSLVFNGFSLSARSLEWSIGEEFEVVTVSVNPKEGPELAKIKQKNYVNHYGRLSAKDGWHFLTGDQRNITALAEQIGFRYKYDPKIQQYAHAAVLIFVTPEGKISRYLYGIDFPHNDLKIALVEASEGTIGTVMEQLLLYCFHYDPDSGSYSFTIFFMMQMAGALTLLILALYLGRFWWKELRGKNKSK